MISPPRTRAEARVYRYGSWLGYPGNRYMEEHCAWEVVGRGARWDHGHQCWRSPGRGLERLYCHQHAQMLVKRDVQT